MSSVTASKQASRWEELHALVEANKRSSPEILTQLLYALAEEVLHSEASNRAEAGESILRSARAVEPMIGLTADSEWAAFSFIRKFQEGFDAAGWKQRRTDELMAEGERLIWS